MENGTKKNRMCRRDTNEGAHSKFGNLWRELFYNDGKQKSEGNNVFLFILLLFPISQRDTEYQPVHQ